MKKVAIILATYNGEKYIKEQLDSLVNQTYSHLDIYVYDDGSKDITKEIIADYKNNYSNIYFYNESLGLGYPKCFINLLEKVSGYDYYAFCDQDDVWNADKIQNAVLKLSTANDELPLLYYSAVEYCDANLKFIRSSRFAEGKSEIVKLRLQDLLFGGEAMGMTYVFNNIAREELIKANESNTHKDWFLKVYCAACGEVYYNPAPTAKYRRHDLAVTNDSNPSKRFDRYVSQFKEIFLAKDGFESQKKVINYINSENQDKLSHNQKELLQLFSTPNNLRKRLMKTFWSKRFRTKLLDELGYRVAFLLGRI